MLLIILTNLERLGKVQKWQNTRIHGLTENFILLWDLPPEISAAVYTQELKETPL